MNQGEWVGQGMWHPREMRTTFWWGNL